MVNCSEKMQSAKKTYDGKIAGLYDLEETLGRGHFAVVKLARHVFTGEKVAVKVIDKTKLDDVSKAHLFQEVRCMKLVQHPNVVRLYEVIDTQTKLYLILELGDGGDLYDYIMKHEAGLGEETAREYFRQIVRAISYCHQLHVVHRDLKPENVVFFERLGVVKLTDFGFSNKFCPGQKLETSCGSLAYSAPEILLGDSYDAPAVDVWSLGVILYMLVVGQAPFQEANDSETLTMIMDCKYTIPTHVSDACRRLIARMLVREPESRATLADIASDPWLGGPPQVEYLPLVSRHQVTEEDHNIIINKMVNGNIATKEEVLEALDRNEYNHITATYFLLAERKLRAHRQEQAQNRVKQNQILISITPSSKNSLNVNPSDANETETLQHPSTASVLNIPKTSGDAPQGRTRKCSIVQEEEEEEYPNVSDERQLTPPHSSLNRRGSRSEGKLNIAIQELIAEERRQEKKESPNGSPLPSNGGRLPAKDDATCWPAKRTSPTSVLTSIPPSYIPNSTKWRMGANKKSPIRNSSLDVNKAQNKCASENLKERIDLKSASVNSASKVTLVQTNEFKTRVPKENVLTDKNADEVIRSSQIKSATRSIPSKMLLLGDNSEISTISLSDSATVTIPVHPTQMDPKVFPKFKTMPSPTRTPHNILTSPPLNEIFEGNVADYNKSNRVGGITGINYEQRRSKFHKTRTASCSSSDASDDDSESRKKRAHKISAEKNNQRRDSHDDSSDNQDRGGSGSGGTGANPNSDVSSSGDRMHNQNNSSSNRQNQSSGGGDGSGNSSSRKHCNGENFRRSRRRTAETRLRESQSLNRITEVQESEGHNSESFHDRFKKKELEDCINRDNVSSGNNNNNDSNNKNTDKNKAILMHNNSNNNNNISNNNNNHRGNTNTNNNNNNNNNDNDNNDDDDNNNKNNNVVSNTEKNKSVKSLGARFLQSWSNTISSTKLSVNKRKCSIDERHSRGNNDVGCTSFEDQVPKQYSDEKENKILLEKSEKKVKLLGKYFQVSKKLCLPLPNLISKGRLYKTRSCGSISKDRIVSSPSAGTSTSKHGVGQTSNSSSGVLYIDRCKSPNILMNQSLDSIDIESKDDFGKLRNKPPVKTKNRSDDVQLYDISPDLYEKDNKNGADNKNIVSKDGSKCPIVGLCQMHPKDAAKCHLS